MEPNYQVVAKVLALLTAAYGGWRVAQIPADWRLDRFNEYERDSVGHLLDASDPLGMYSGCMSFWVSIVNELHEAFRSGKLLEYFLPVVGIILAAIGWPPNPAIWQERLGFILILFGSWLWFPAAAWLIGYLAGRLMHRGFFRD